MYSLSLWQATVENQQERLGNWEQRGPLHVNLEYLEADLEKHWPGNSS
jgi:hypothetical protein